MIKCIFSSKISVMYSCMLSFECIFIGNYNYNYTFALIWFCSSLMTNSSDGSRQEKCRMINKLRGSADEKVGIIDVLASSMGTIFSFHFIFVVKKSVIDYTRVCCACISDSQVKGQEVSSEISKYFHW